MEIAVVFGSLTVALIVVLASAVSARKWWSSAVGPPNWDFTKSWATNITVLGAVFTIFFSSKIVAAPRLVGDPGYPMLSVLFAVVVALSPLLFRAISKESGVLTPQGTDDIQYQGNAIGFLLAMLLTLWAAIGQIGTLGLLATEVLVGGRISPIVPGGLLAVLAIGAVATMWYGWSTAEPLLGHQSDRVEHAKQLKAQMTASAANLDTFAPSKAPLPGWRLL